VPAKKDVTTNRTSFLRGNRRGHHNGELKMETSYYMWSWGCYAFSNVNLHVPVHMKLWPIWI